MSNSLVLAFVRAARLSVAVLSVAFVAPPARAQCPVPDGLDGGPCCVITTDKVPAFPKIKQRSLDICWKDCGVDNVSNVIAVWTPLSIQPPTGPDCSYRLERLDIQDPAGVVLWTGTMRLLYARTWLEVLPSGVTIQVWRFLVNGDLRSTSTAATIPCPTPACAPAFGNRVRYTGYIDYAQECGAAGTTTSIAWMLTHACDAIDHFVGFPRAGAFHPDRSYTFVGPSLGFVPAPVGATEVTAGSPFESTRRLRHPTPGTTGPILCEFEERAAVVINPNANFCLCATGAPLNQQWYFANVNVNGACGTNLVSGGGPILPGFFSMSIGTWTNAAAYPGVEYVRWNAADYADLDPCLGTLAQKFFFGATTFGGFPARQMTSGGPGVALPPNFLDQANSIRAGGGLTLNTPFLSDQIVNLNF